MSIPVLSGQNVSLYTITKTSPEKYHLQSIPDDISDDDSDDEGVFFDVASDRDIADRLILEVVFKNPFTNEPRRVQKILHPEMQLTEDCKESVVRFTSREPVFFLWNYQGSYSTIRLVMESPEERKVIRVFQLYNPTQVMNGAIASLDNRLKADFRLLSKEEEVGMSPQLSSVRRRLFEEDKSASSVEIQIDTTRQQDIRSVSARFGAIVRLNSVEVTLKDYR